MYETFDKILINNTDDKMEKRLKTLEKSGLINTYAADNILNDIVSVLN